MSGMKDTRQLLREIQSVEGVEVKAAKRNSHLKVFYRGRLVTVLPKTSGDWRGVLNARAALRRAGVLK